MRESFHTVSDVTTTKCVCGARSALRVLSTSERRFRLGGEFRLVRCTQCNLVRTDPAPEDPGAYYPDGYYAYQPAKLSERALARFQPSYRSRRPQGLRRRLAPGMPPGPPAKILDVGCGTGAFLLGLRSAGWDVHGIELDPQAAAVARDAGLDVKTGDLTTTDVGDEYDVVRFWHSLEHTPDPRAELEAALQVLKPFGLLVVGVPNYGSLLSRTSRGRWFNLDVPRHLWHFERRTLARVVQDAGFWVAGIRHLSTSQPLLGTIDYALGRRDRLTRNRHAWYAALPIAALLDAFECGDALDLIAVKRSGVAVGHARGRDVSGYDGTMARFLLDTLLDMIRPRAGRR